MKVAVQKFVSNLQITQGLPARVIFILGESTFHHDNAEINLTWSHNH